MWNEVVTNADTISTVSGELALVAAGAGCEPCAGILGGISLITGAISTGKDISDGDYIWAVIDGFGTSLGGSPAPAKLFDKAATLAWDFDRLAKPPKPHTPEIHSSSTPEARRPERRACSTLHLLSNPRPSPNVGRRSNEVPIAAADYGSITVWIVLGVFAVVAAGVFALLARSARTAGKAERDRCQAQASWGLLPSQPTLAGSLDLLRESATDR